MHLEFLTHQQKVCRLYKRALRAVHAIHYDRCHTLFHQAFIRQKFEQNRCINQREAEHLIEKGDNLVFQSVIFPFKFPTSPYAGCAYSKEVLIPDWVLDFWHPLEKARFPKYFETREKRKKEYLEMWNKMYGRPEDE